MDDYTAAADDSSELSSQVVDLTTITGKLALLKRSPKQWPDGEPKFVPYLASAASGGSGHRLVWPR